MKKNILEELPWFWAKTRQKLLKIAGSVDNIATISEDEIEKILNKNQIETLKDYWIIW
jgi:ERCC4-type nuclease